MPPSTDWLGLVHTIAATLAVLLGPAVFLRRKGDAPHRRLGYAYVASMTTLNVTSLFITDLFGGWGPFHVGALVSLATLAAGFVPAFLRRPRRTWLEWHYMGMCWSYVGLAAAGLAEALTRLPSVWPALGAAAPQRFFWTMTAVGTFVVCGVGSYVIRVRRVGFPDSSRAARG